MVKIGILGRVVNKSGDLSLSHLAGSETKDKQQRVNDIRLSRAIGSNHRRERGMERTDFLSPSITLEVIENEVCENNAGFGSDILDRRNDHGALLENDVDRVFHHALHGLDGLKCKVVIVIDSGGGDVAEYLGLFG